MRPRMVAAMSLCWYAIVALAEDFADDATLPAVNVRYEFAARDTTGGGPALRDIAELHGFKQRAAHVMESSTADSESLADFASRANDDLDALMEILGPKPDSLAAKQRGVGLRGRGKRLAAARAEPAEEIGEQLIDAKLRVDQMDALKSEITSLIPRVNAGGRKARDALVRLIDLSSQPNAKTVMKVMGVQSAASKLMRSPSSSEGVQQLAGSVLTAITGMPVTSQISDEKTGSHGHINVVVPRPSRVYGPDQTLLELASGVAPSDTSAGDYVESPEVAM